MLDSLLQVSANSELFVVHFKFFDTLKYLEKYFDTLIVLSSLIVVRMTFPSILPCGDSH